MNAKMPTSTEDLDATIKGTGDLFPSCHCFDQRGPRLERLHGEMSDIAQAIDAFMGSRNICPKAGPYVIAHIAAHSMLMRDRSVALMTAQFIGTPEIDERVAEGEDLMAVVEEVSTKRLLADAKTFIDTFNRILVDLNKRDIDHAASELDSAPITGVQ